MPAVLQGHGKAQCFRVDLAAGDEVAIGANDAEHAREFVKIIGKSCCNQCFVLGFP